MDIIDTLLSEESLLLILIIAAGTAIGQLVAAGLLASFKAPRRNAIPPSPPR